jgi:hypothetical protein
MRGHMCIVKESFDMEVDFSKRTFVQIPLGHLLLAWDVLSEKFSDLHSNDSLSEEEKRAIWGLVDLLENTLVANGVTSRSQAEWSLLIDQAKQYMKTLPVDFLE